MKIALIGYGTIGRALASAIRDGRAGNARLITVLGRDAARLAATGAARDGCKATTDPEEFFNADADLIVEAAGQSALVQYAERGILSGRDLLAASVGALVDEHLVASITRAARSTGRKLLVPSGALGGLDVVSAAAVGVLDEVSIEVRKPPAAWRGTPAEGAAALAVDHPICFYEGAAGEAVKLFPQNVNVVAALSLSGIGFERTTVEMFADPTVQHNTFELFARGEFGEIRLELKNRPYPENPKTGYLVVMSLIKSIRRLQEPIVIGF